MHELNCREMKGEYAKGESVKTKVEEINIKIERISRTHEELCDQIETELHVSDEGRFIKAEENLKVLAKREVELKQKRLDFESTEITPRQNAIEKMRKNKTNLVSKLSKDLDQIKHLRQEAEDLLGELCRAMTNLRGDHAALKTQVELSCSTVDKLEKQIENILTTIEKTQIVLDDKKAKRDAIAGKSNEIYLKKSQVEREIEKCEQDIKQKEDEMVNLDRELVSVSAKCKQLKSNREGLDRSYKIAIEELTKDVKPDANILDEVSKEYENTDCDRKKIDLLDWFFRVKRFSRRLVENS